MYARTKRASTRTGLALIGAGALAAATALQAPPAQALVQYASVHVLATWQDADCIVMHGPSIGSGYRLSRPTWQCAPGGNPHMMTWDYLASPGEWIGVDPDITGTGASSVFCSVTVNGRLVMVDSAEAGDGHEATCLDIL